MSRSPLAAILIVATLGACTDTEQASRRSATAYDGPRSNVMDCNSLTLAQRQFVNLYRYGCADLMTPADAGDPGACARQE